MSLKNLAVDNSIKESGDSLGGNGPLNSDLYKLKVDLAYLGKSNVPNSKAQSVTIHFKTEDNRELKETFWVTNGEGHTYSEKNNEKTYLPGFQAVQALSLLTIGKDITELDSEEKTISLWDYKTKAKAPVKVQMLTELLGQEILAGVIRQNVDKTAKDVAGNYVPTGETREESVIDKFFRERDNMTVAEIKARAPEATFYKDWQAKWAGKVRNKAKGVNGTAGVPGVPAATTAATAQPAKKSLFG